MVLWIALRVGFEHYGRRGGSFSVCGLRDGQLGRRVAMGAIEDSLAGEPKDLSSN
jgi:hypothetical protein